MIVLTDLGCAGEAAIRVGVELAAEQKAELHVVHGMDLTGLSLREAFVALHTGIQQWAGDALNRQVRELCSPSSIDVKSIVDPRSGSRVVIELVPEVDVGMIIVGFERNRVHSRSESTDVALQIAVATAAPVLLTGGALRWPPLTVFLDEDMGMTEDAPERDHAWVGSSADRLRGDPSTHLCVVSGETGRLGDQARRWLQASVELDLLLIPTSKPDESDRPPPREIVVPLCDPPALAG